MKVRDMVLVSLFAALTAVGAFIRVPIPYVPFTLQFFFCAFAGVLLGSKLGALSQALYVGIGLMGVPVFTKGGGIGYVFQPTFGYLIGFILGAFVIGKIVEICKEKNLLNIMIATASGLAVVYLCGVPYLYLALKYFAGTPISIQKAIYIGFLICVGGDLVSCFIVSVVSKKVLPTLRKMGIRQEKATA